MQNFNFFTDICAKSKFSIQYSHTIWSACNFIKFILKDSLINSKYISIYTIIIMILSLILVLYIIFIEKEEWKIITILTIMMITFPHVSFDYTLIHMFIPITYFIISPKTKKWEDIVYSILLAFTIIPMNWYQTVIDKIFILNIGLIIRPTIMLTIILLIVITTLKNRMKFKKINKNNMVLNEI